MECSAINTCMNCDHDTNECYAIEKYPLMTVSEFGTAHGDYEIMAEIYARGPLAANIDATCLEDYKGGINMYDTCNTVLVNHAISLNGWGTEVSGT
jgi:cathepsin X